MLTFLGAVIIWHAVKKNNAITITFQFMSVHESAALFFRLKSPAAAALISSQQQQQARPAALFTQVVAVMTDWLIRGEVW